MSSIGLESIPCPNSIENWVKKSGYKIYHTPHIKESSTDYAEIVDESMMLGSEKMLLVLGVDAKKTGDKALQKQDAEVMSIAVASNWNSANIEKELTKVEKKVGNSPSYVVSDNDVKLKKSINKDKGYKHIQYVDVKNRHKISYTEEINVILLSHESVLLK